MIVGLDFDNTLVTYDAVIHRAAVELGLIPAGVPVNKREIRDFIRRNAEGDIGWQRVQARVYGPLMMHAQLIEGVAEFVRGCRSRGWRACIVSHKTVFAGYDETGTNLRETALGWMRDQRFFDAAGLGFAEADVFFESTRPEKVDRIRTLNCSVFVDDLEEVFLEPAFPLQTQRILFMPEGIDGAMHHESGATIFASWQSISEHVLHGAK